MTYVFCKYVLVYEAASKCALATADTYVNSQNLSSYTKVSIIRFMYICEYFHVYKEVQSVSVRQGINICELAQLGFIYKSIYSMIHVYL